MKKRLLQRRREIIAQSFYEDEEDESEKQQTDLSTEELGEIHEILQGGDLEEEDAELILTVMRSHTADVVGKIPHIVKEFPHLAKNVYKFCSEIEEKEVVAEILLSCLNEKSGFQEYQLFWFGMMLESYLLTTNKAPKLMEVIFQHKNSTDISKAKILEIPDLRYGLPDLRHQFLSSGKSDWLSWSSAVGSRSLKKAARNHTLQYFMKSSPMNFLIGEVIKNFEA